MDPKEKPTEELKKIKPADFIYLGVISLFLIIIIILFFYSTNFIAGNVNKIFSSSEQKNDQALDAARYSLVEKKLNLPVNIAGNTAINIPVVQPVTQNVGTTTINTTVAVKPTLDKKSITINILNNTNKTGVASTLAKTLTDAGFTKATLGNGQKVYAVTTILIKDSKKDYAPLVEEVVKTTYPKVVTNTNPENSNFDVIIIISN